MNYTNHNCTIVDSDDIICMGYKMGLINLDLSDISNPNCIDIVNAYHSQCGDATFNNFEIQRALVQIFKWLNIDYTSHPCENIFNDCNIDRIKEACVYYVLGFYVDNPEGSIEHKYGERMAYDHLSNYVMTGFRGKQR